MSAARSRGELEIFADAEALARHGAETFARLAGEAHRRGEPFAAALTGGGSPVRMYRLLGGELAERVPWESVHLFWGDERAVPPDHPRSNFGMAREAMVGRVPIPSGNVHRIRGELGAERAAREYEAELRGFFGSRSAALDLVHLGVGEDGHVASLFPFDLPRLLERERLAVPSLRRELGEPRITLTLPVLNAADRVEVLFPEGRKAEIARRVVDGPLDPFRVPAQLVRPLSGKLVWALSRDAARNLRAE